MDETRQDLVISAWILDPKLYYLRYLLYRLLTGWYLKNGFFTKTFLELCLAQEELLRTRYKYSICKKYLWLEEIKKITITISLKAKQSIIFF
jgi:hypothetical protein